jgi:hypothetical protein
MQLATSSASPGRRRRSTHYRPTGRRLRRRAAASSAVTRSSTKPISPPSGPVMLGFALTGAVIGYMANFGRQHRRKRTD